jgi:phage-related minor tail protein
MTEELKIIITAEIDKLKQEMKKGSKEVEDFGKKSKVSMKDVGDTMTKAGDISKKALAGVATAVAGAATALLALGASTKEFRENQAKLNSAFEAAGSSAEEAADVYDGLYRVLGDDDRAVEAAGHLAKLSTNQKDLSSWTKICQGIYATFGDSLPIEGLTEAANETARTGAVTGVLADALNWAGVSEDDFNAKLEKCRSTQEREKLIRETLNGLYDDAANKYEENADSILASNEAQIKLNKEMAKLGEAMQPINTMLAEFGNEILAEITPILTEFAEEHGPAIKEALGEIAEKIGGALDFIIENWDLISTISIVILAIATALSVFSTVMGIVNAVMLASPVTWIVLAIVAAIAALIAIIVLVVKHWDEIKAKTLEVWEKMKTAVSEGVEKIKGFFEKIINFVKENWQGLLLLIINPFAGAFKLAYDNCEGFRNFVDGFIEKVKNGFKKGFELVKKYTVDPIIEAKNKVVETFNNIKNGALEKIESLKEKIKSIVETIKGFFNFEFKTPKIKTPKFSITPDGWKVGDLLDGVIPKLSIKWNAEGGVFTKPTLTTYGNTLQGLGENGAEAIVPLEKNTEWLDKIADKLVARQSNKPVILNVDGKEFARTSINTINDYTRQTGSLALNVI